MNFLCFLVYLLLFFINFFLLNYFFFVQILKCISQLELAQLIGTGVKRKFLTSNTPATSSSGSASQGHHNDLLDSGDGKEFGTGGRAGKGGEERGIEGGYVLTSNTLATSSSGSASQ